MGKERDIIVSRKKFRSLYTKVKLALTIIAIMCFGVALLYVIIEISDTLHSETIIFLLFLGVFLAILLVDP